MKESSFDRITRRLAVTTSRRRGIVSLVAGALGIASISAAEAVITVPPGCGATGRLCTSGDDCCSLRCIAKRDGTMRCARTSSNRRKKKIHHDGGGSTTCLAEDATCPTGDGCCADLVCFASLHSSDSVCRTCGAIDDYCNHAVGATCCAGLLCGENGGGSTTCCIGLGSPCTANAQCCGSHISETFCFNSICALQP